MPVFRRGSFGIAVYARNESKALSSISVQTPASVIRRLGALCKQRRYAACADLLRSLPKPFGKEFLRALRIRSHCVALGDAIG